MEQLILKVRFITDLWNYLQELHTLVGNLFERMSKIQSNLVEIKETMKDWSVQPLFERREGKKVRQSIIELMTMYDNV